MLPAMNQSAPPPELGAVEARLAVLAWAFEASGHLVFVADARGCVLFANARARTAWTFLRDAPVSQLLPPSGAEGFEAALATASKSGAAAQFAWGEQSTAGARTWYHSTLSPLVVDESIAFFLCV